LVGAFAEGNVLQVLFIAVLSGSAYLSSSVTFAKSCRRRTAEDHLADQSEAAGGERNHRDPYEEV